MKEFLEYIWNWLTDIWHFLGGIVMSFLGYLLPIKDLILFITVLFIIDVAFGFWKSHKFDNTRFSPKLIWKKTVPRWLFSVIIIALLFLWDKVHHQDFVSTYYVGGYFLSGVVLASIIENAGEITGWKMFLGLQNIVSRNVEKNTGEKIQEDEIE